MFRKIYFIYVYVNMYKYIYSYMYVYIPFKLHLFDEYFLWVLDLFMCRKQKSIFAVKTKSSHSHCKRLYCTTKGFKAQQTALMHNRQFYCTAVGITTKSFTARQKALMHSRKLYCTAGSFIAQQKVLLHSRKVSLAAETREKFLLRQKLEKSSFYGRNRG